MSVENCKTSNPRRDVDVLGLVAFCADGHRPVNEDFRRCYVEAIRGEKSDWFLIRIYKIGVNIELTFYNRQTDRRESVILDLQSRNIQKFRLRLEVPHKDKRPDTIYTWDVLRDESAEITTVIRYLLHSERVICYAEGDDDIAVTEYTDL